MMPPKKPVSFAILSTIACLLAIAFAQELVWTANGQEKAASSKPADATSAEEKDFNERVKPVLKEFCFRCHNADNMKSGIRVDQLSATPEDRLLFLLKGIQQQVDDEIMPPAEEPQPTDEQRKILSAWMAKTLTVARTRKVPKNGSARRLTVSQYRNTLKDLLKLEEDLTDVLPPDGISKDGFANNGHTMVLSPLQVEAYFEIAEKALDLCIVDEAIKKTTIQNFRMELCASINPNPCPDKLILGANSELLNNADFVVTDLKPSKSFEYQPFAMRTAYDFIEGYAGNDTVRGWRKYDSIYHSVFACVRGSPGYPKGEPNQVIPAGLALRPAIPSSEIFGVSNTYGPMANFKISLRELPDQGNFRVTVKAARYDDGILLDAGTPLQAAAADSTIAADVSATAPVTVTMKDMGIYQVDASCVPGKSQGLFSLTLGERQFAGQLYESNPEAKVDAAQPERSTPFLVVRLPAGELKVQASDGNQSRLRRVLFSRVNEDSYLGLRRDCGSTLAPVGKPKSVQNGDLQDYVFEGAIRDYPSPDVEKDNVNYLAGIREIGVRSEWTDGRDMPRLLVRSIEFEGPFYETWPPATHRNIFIESAHEAEPETYAREIVRSFATRAFRRPVTEIEEAGLMRVWQSSFAQTNNAHQSIKDTLLVVLTSPQFLFLVENSGSPEAEDLDGFELASKLSYFLWNTSPDLQLLELAAQQRLNASLDTEIERMIRDPKFGQFIDQFASQWLSLDKFDVVSIDSKRYPKLTRDAKTQLRQEPVQFLRYLIEQNLPLRNLVQSDFIVANDVVASYYGLPNQTESGFQFVPIQHSNPNLGGVLNQAGILSGLSDGRESNPIKRGAWLARKMIATPPDDPPPNVPQLKEDDATKLTLRERLERHRNQKGCAKCHSGIDPWGVPFESFDAGGLPKTTAADAHSTLPDGTEIKDLNALKTYLAKDRIDQVAFSFLKHLACYAVGRSLTYNEILFLQEQSLTLKAGDYRMQDLVRFVVKSDLFLKK
jgi:cytochrome c553